MTTINYQPVQLSEQSKTILEHRYFLKDDDSNIIETPEELFERVAKGVASVETLYGTLPVESDLSANEFYEIMTNFEFVPNSPTLMNAGWNCMRSN